MMEKTEKRNDWLEELWASDPELADFGEEEDYGYAFIRKVSEELERRGLRRSDLATKMGRSPSFVTQVMASGRNLTVKTMVRLVRALDGKLVLEAEFPVAQLQAPAQVQIVQHEAGAWYVRSTLSHGSDMADTAIGRSMRPSTYGLMDRPMAGQDQDADEYVSC